MKDYKTIINKLPNFFNSKFDFTTNDENIFRKLDDVVNFDSGYIYFLNADCAQLKYSYSKDITNSASDKFSYPETIKKDLFSGDEIKSTTKIIKLAGLNLQPFGKHYSIIKLQIKNITFGILILVRNTEFEEAEIAALKACATMLAYLIKDLELSNVFKIQLKALKDGIMEKNNAYKTIQEQNEKILEADKIKNEFLANVSHELRTPLNAIIGFSEILSANLFGELNEKQSEYVQDIKVSGIHLLGMINEILDISKIESHAMKLSRSTFSISRAITEAANILEPLAIKKTIKIITEYNDFEVFADYQKIQQILYNLVSNAIKFTPKNGIVTISAKATKKEFTIMVKDTGIGIDKKYHGKIFAKFVQLDSAYTKKESSTGLGLTITKELTELHGGKIAIKSEVDKGSTFIVTMPLLKE